MPTFRADPDSSNPPVEEGRYYAFIQSVKEDSVTLEITDATNRLLDNSRESVSWRSELREHWNTALRSTDPDTRRTAGTELASSLQEFRSSFITVSTAQTLDEITDNHPSPAPDIWNQWHEQGRWLVLEVTVSAGSTGTIEHITAVSQPRQRLLERAFGMSLWPSAAASDIAIELNTIVDIAACVVLDVGQASANALVSFCGRPYLYFDAGAPQSHDIATSATYCTHEGPLVILSHWHKDHWAGEKHNPALLALKWIAPRQKISLHQSQFASRIIAAGGELLIMKRNSVGRKRADLQDPLSPGLLLEYCSGPQGNLNSCGLALQVSWPQHDEHWLFPGDADYKYLPPRMTTPNAPTLLVATHHGAAPFARTHAPSPGAKLTNRRLIYSYGAHNTYSHPTPRAKTAHETAGWTYPASGYWGADVRATVGSAAQGRCSIMVGIDTVTLPTGHLTRPPHNLTIRT